MDQDAVDAVVREIEEEQALGRLSAVKVFRGMLNQPTLVSISSVNANAVGSGDSFSSFTVDMPRPILEVDNLQLATVNIPLCTQNIPDTACVFWYYRLSLYSGKYPNTNNLYWVRLLPSYYKPEFIKDYENYGFNQTFGGYSDVSTQLALATTRDLALDHFTTENLVDPFGPYHRFQYFPNNYTPLVYNPSINKFEFSGNYGLPNDTSPQLIVTRYSSGATYALDKIVMNTLYTQGYGYLCYKSRVAGNIGNPLPVYPAIETTYWTREFSSEGVAPWGSTTPYKIGQFVQNPLGGVDTLYRAKLNSINIQPTDTDYWLVNPAPAFPYRFLATGPSDPNVVFMQGSGKRQWQQQALFEDADYVVHQGITYQARRQNLGFEPFYIPNQTDNLYSNVRQYSVGEYVFVAGSPGRYYINIKASLGIAPASGVNNNANWNFIEYDPNRPSGSVSPGNQFYQVGDLVTYVGYAGTPFFKCIKANPPAGSLTGDGVLFGGNEFWVVSYWNPTTFPAPIVGLTDLSAEFDMANDLQGLFFAPFPAAIPPQPFAVNPKRLLNSILGFTWNGKFTNSMFNTLYEEIPTSGSTTLTQLYNRLRPVPEYVVDPPGDDLTALPGAGSAILNFKLTANGYANLVYTAIISVYATIVGGSTLDTQRNTNLIGTMAMSAGNLGIGFGANYIEVPLRAGDGDIYSMTFEFRDDYDEPYPLTNNAAVTITLKLGYKESRK
jgi:hypothetical protein